MDPTSDTELAAMVAEQAGRLLQQEVTRAMLEAMDRGEVPLALWSQLQEAGLPQALVPEAQGGIGLVGSIGFSLVRLAGLHGLPLPLGETMIARALWCAAGGSQQPDDAAPLTLATDVPGYGALLQRDGAGWRLSARLASVPFGRVAGALLLVARDAADDAFLVRVPARDLAWASERNLAGEPRDHCALHDVPVAAEDVRKAPAACLELGLQPFGALLRTHQMVGAMDRCLELALAYAAERQQFGRRISSFSPVQFMLVEVAGELAAAAAAAEGAAEAWDSAFEDGGAEAFLLQVAAAKSRAGEAAGKVAAACHQVHGAIGFTQEHALHHFTRRLWSWRDEFGNESRWNEWLGRRICAGGGAALWPLVTGL